MSEGGVKFSFSLFRSLDGWRKFFMGRVYPAAVAALVLIGNLFAIDYYVNFLVTFLFVFAMIISDSVRPAIITACAYIYQVSIPHAPSYPTYSDFLFSGWRRPMSIVIVASVVFAFLFFFFKKKMWRRISLRTPLFTGLLAFCTAMMLNGAFSPDWTYKNLVFAILNTFIYFIFYLVFFLGFTKEESYEDILSYFVYISMLLALIIIPEMTCLYLTSDTIFAGGEIVKVEVALGWGIWNVIGTSLAVLIPTLFIGAMGDRCPWLYFFVATITLVFSILSMSRNALIFATLAYCASLVIACFFARNKRAFRIILALGAVALALFALVFFGKIKMLLGDYFERGFSDNGRYNLWSLAVDTFKRSPIFGNGFYGFFTTEIFEFGSVPRMAHNTILEILSAMGIVGILAYGWYRFKTAELFVRRPSVSKTMLAISVLVLLFGSLLDNFMFNLHPVIYYTVIMAIVAHKETESL